MKRVLGSSTCRLQMVWPLGCGRSRVTPFSLAIFGLLDLSLIADGGREGRASCRLNLRGGRAEATRRWFFSAEHGEHSEDRTGAAAQPR